MIPFHVTASLDSLDIGWLGSLPPHRGLKGQVFNHCTIYWLPLVELYSPKNIQLSKPLGSFYFYLWVELYIDLN